jgi:DNA-binding LacI/PurR family transcriptional regulator
MGYRPDPEIARLMRHLRSSRTSQGKVGLALLDFYPSVRFEENSYNHRIRQGAIDRAGELGFGVTPLHGVECEFNLKRLLKVIRHRGLDGVVLLPSVAPIELDARENWEGLAVVATSASILSPRFHSVVPHQFANMMRLIETLQARGHRKICAIFDEFFDERTAHNFTAAVNWHHHGERTLVLSAKLPIAEKADRVAQWILQHEPDLIFAQASDAVTSALPKLKRLGLSRIPEVVGLGAPVSPSGSHVDERPELVGSAAVDLLAGMIYYHENGIPEHPRTTMIDCEFHLAQPAG